MVSDKKVFPTKDNRWESLARKPMIPDNRELEKVFKDRKEICLLNLPLPEKKVVHSYKTGNYGMLFTRIFNLTFGLLVIPSRDYGMNWTKTTLVKIQYPDCCCKNFLPGSRDRPNTVPAFNESDRSLFLNICGIRQLSRCVKSEPQTESLSACPTVQAMVRSLIPYIQRFLYHHHELHEVYFELVKNNIAEKIKRLSFRQVWSTWSWYEF